VIGTRFPYQGLVKVLNGREKQDGKKNKNRKPLGLPLQKKKKRRDVPRKKKKTKDETLAVRHLFPGLERRGDKWVFMEKN